VQWRLLACHPLPRFFSSALPVRETNASEVFGESSSEWPRYRQTMLCGHFLSPNCSSLLALLVQLLHPRGPCVVLEAPDLVRVRLLVLLVASPGRRLLRVVSPELRSLVLRR